MTSHIVLNICRVGDIKSRFVGCTSNFAKWSPSQDDWIGDIQQFCFWTITWNLDWQGTLFIDHVYHEAEAKL